MPDTSFYYTGRQAERLAAVHARRDGKLEATPRELVAGRIFSGAGGLVGIRRGLFAVRADAA